MREHRKRPRRRAFLFLGLVVSWAFVASVSSAALEISVEVGFQRVFYADAWAPVTITVDNPGASGRGTLYLVAKKGGLFSANPWEQTVAQEVEVPGAATGRYRFTMSMSDLLTRYRVELRLDDGRVARVEDEVVGLASDRRLIVAVTGSQTFDFLLTDTGIALSYLRPETAPVEWHAYDGAQMVIVGDADPRRYDEASLEAIQRWVASGGTVFVAAPNGRLARDLFSLNFSATAGGDAPVGFTTVEEGVYSRDFGRGSILYGTPRALLYPRLFAQTAGDPVPEARSTQGLRTTPLLTQVAGNIESRTPVLPVVLLLGLFVVVASVLILRRFRIVAPVIAVLAGVVMIVLTAQDTLPELVRLEIVRADSASHQAEVDSRVLLFSRRPSQTSIGFRNAYFLPPEGRDSLVWSLAPEVGRVEIHSPRRWNESLVSFRSTRRFALSVRFEGRDGSIVRVRNDESRPIRDLRLHWAGSDVSLGELAPDASVTAIAPATGLDPDEKSSTLRDNGQSTIEGIVRRNVLEELGESLVLTGFLDEPLVDLEFEPGHAKAQTAVMVYAVLDGGAYE